MAENDGTRRESGEDSVAGARRRLLDLDLPLASFLADWKHCDHYASYIARMVSASQADPVRHANLLSSAINELLETFFRACDCRVGTLSCTVSRQDGVDRISLTFPCGRGARAFFTEAEVLCRQPNLEALYVEALLTDGPVSPFAGLLELIADYRARFSLTEVKGGLTITLDLNLHSDQG